MSAMPRPHVSATSSTFIAATVKAALDIAKRNLLSCRTTAAELRAKVQATVTKRPSMTRQANEGDNAT